MTTIKEIKELLATVKELDNPLFLEFEKDPRSGVQKEIYKRKKAIQVELDENLRLETMLSYEKELYKRGVTLVAGVDEVGRGPLAGPVVAAAVILPKNCKIRGLNDSKKIPKKKHLEIYHAVQDQALAIGIGIMDNHIIDQVNIYEATKLAMKEAGVEPEQIDYINAHGTSTHHNDLFETRAIKYALGDAAKNVQINSTKSMIGHLLGAAGGVEFVVCVKSIQDGFIHQTVGTENVDPECDLNYTVGAPVEKDINYVLTNSLGFGGHNATLLVKKYEG